MKVKNHIGSTEKYPSSHGIKDMDIDATMPSEHINDPLGLLEEGKLPSKKKSRPKNKSEIHETILPDPRVQTGESIVLLAALSSMVGRISILKIVTDLSITEDELASPLSLIHHTGMITIIPNVRHPMSSMDYDIQLTEKGKSLAGFLVSAEQERRESIAKKLEAAESEKKPSKKKASAKSSKSAKTKLPTGRHEMYESCMSM